MRYILVYIPRGLSLNPIKRNKGHMFYYIYQGLAEEVYLSNYENGHLDSAYVINVYVHIQESML